MPNIIQHKRSSTPGAVPLATGLSQGELGINIGDGKLYTKNSSNAIINLGVSSISGTYITPASGNFTQSLQVNGTGVSVSGHAHVSNDVSDFASTVSGLLPVKDLVSGSGISIGSTSGVYTISAFGVAASSASSLITRADNKTGSTISKMSVVYINGGHGNRPTIQKSIASSESTSSKTYGVTASDINDNQTGDIIVVGALIDVNTNQFGASEGSTLYLSPSISGGITSTKPLAPNHLVTIGKIVRNHSTQGIIEVSIQNGFELYELHDVAVTGATSGQFLQYNSNSGLWVPSSSGNFTFLSVNSTGVSVSGHTHTSSNITDFNSSVSGLLPTIANSGDNRVLTSTGSSLGINAESNLTFNGSLLSVTGSGVFSSGIIASNISVTGNMISATNINGNLIIKPNASGALQADNAGNSRGIYSVDLQRSRISVSGVAHGDYSVIGGGSNNNAMGPLCTIGGGSNNTAGGDYYPGNCSTIGGGENNISIGEKSTVGGGSSNSAGGNYSIVGGGQSNSAGGMHSTVGGGDNNSAIANKSTISGGTGNSSSGEYSIVGGGRSNSAAGYISAVCGGNSNSASGSHSTVGGGQSNSASNYHSTVGGGQSNSAGGTHSTVGGGYLNTANGNKSTVGGGYNNSAGGDYSIGSTVGGGKDNTAGGDYSIGSTVCGGTYNSAGGDYSIGSTVGGGHSNSAGIWYCTVPGGIQAKATRYGEMSHSAGQFTNQGDAQHTILIARNSTVNASGTVLFLDGSSARLTIPPETTWIFTTKLSAYNDTDNLRAGYNIRGCIGRNAAPSGTSIIGSNIVESWVEGAMSGCVATVTADTANEALQINVNGLTSKNIRWVAVVDISQVSYGTP